MEAATRVATRPATYREDVNKVTSVLKQKFLDIDSGAKLLKIPHLGFRLVGTVHEGAS